MRPWPVAVLVVLAVPAATAGAADRSCLTPHSWEAGTTTLCRGTIVHGDYVNDDHGADTGAVSTQRTALLAPAAGDAIYPRGQEATADLVRLTVAARGDRLVVTALLGALLVPDSTVVAVAIDADDDRATGGGPWPGLGVRSDGWESVVVLERGDPATNTIRGTLPLPRGPRWRLQAVTAIRATGRVMNVAFRGRERAGWTLRTLTDGAAGTWFEDEQAAALRAGDITRFGFTVRTADLRRRVTRIPEPRPGFQERVYESGHTVPPQGEGVDVAGVPGRGNGGPSVQRFQYLGRYQPYGLYVPDAPGPHGLQLVLHGSNSSLAGLINQPGMQRDLGDRLDRILVVPEARGSEGFGSDISERDVLDVLDDVRASHEVDQDRVFAGGYSQGGYVAARLAALYPHRFAGLLTWVGFTGDYFSGTPLEGALTGAAVGHVVDLVGNLRHVPSVLLYAAADELVPVASAVGLRQALAATDGAFRFYLHPLAEHLTFALLDDWAKEAQDTRGMRRVRRPTRVTYRTSPWLDDPDHGIVHDHAYWVSRIRARTGGRAFADVDLTTSACGGTVPRLARRTGTGARPVPWIVDEHAVTGADPLPRRDALEGALTNVASLHVAVTPACLRRRAFRYRLRTDGPVTLTFGDRRTLRLPGAGEHAGRLAAPPRKDPR